MIGETDAIFNFIETSAMRTGYFPVVTCYLLQFVFDLLYTTMRVLSVASVLLYFTRKLLLAIFRTACSCTKLILCVIMC